MPEVADTFRILGDTFDRSPAARERYEAQVASMGRVLDIGGRNQQSRSSKRLRDLSSNPDLEIVSTDIVADYDPDLVDDITDTRIEHGSFDGIYCDAVLEHVTDPEAAITNIHAILREGGEAFIYIPFIYMFHDLMDHHRVTVTELARTMESRFSEVRVFLPGPTSASGYGFIVTHVLTYGLIERMPRIQGWIITAINRMLDGAIGLWYGRKTRDFSLEEARLFYTHLVFNHGFCAWVRK